MSFARTVLLTLVFAVTGCAKPAPLMPVSVQDVIDNIHAWNGKIVTVDGWLGKCGGLDCHIHPTLADAKTIALIDYSNDAWKGAMDRAVGIGYDSKFDQTAEPLQLTRVLLKARVSDRCRGWFVGCTDRAPDLTPISIQPNPSGKGE